MFSQFSRKDFVKLDVLESKFTIYENLSKEMLEKLENAVDKISESNQRIANILAKHDEKIENSMKTDDLIIKMIENSKQENSKEHKAVITRLESVEKTIDDLLKFRWQVAAIAGAVVLVVGLVTPYIDNMLGSSYNGRTEHTTTK
jgi:ElaB/YqjD/DUF883 family membrane-anchored ribosome-binding protein